MKRMSYSTLMMSAGLALALAATAYATPNPNSAFLALRTFNDCPISTLTSTNLYPALISITDTMDSACVGFANLHSWSFSEDGGASAAVYNNNSNFRLCATFNISGAGEGEGGLRISPWWGQYVDGRFMANATTGEIACFGGRLKGTDIYMEATYVANDLNQSNPATIQYRVTYNAITYDSPVINFDEGNPNEDPPYGLWGMLNDGRVGGYFQVRADTGASLTGSWREICYTNLDSTPTSSSSWGRLKVLYR